MNYETHQKGDESEDSTYDGVMRTSKELESRAASARLSTHFSERFGQAFGGAFVLLDMDMFLCVSQFCGVLCKWEARAGDDG
jgi:hypothetical protein